MKPITFDDVNVILTSGDANVGNLPAHKGNGFWITRWKPSVLERLSILLFGNVWCAIASDGHPPLALYGGRAAHFELPESVGELVTAAGAESVA